MATSINKPLIWVSIILLLAFGFSYRYEGPPTLSAWFGAFILALIIVSISFFVHELAHKIVGKKLGILVEPKLWISGAITLVLLLILSNGAIVFAAPWAVYMRAKSFRPGTPWPHISPKEKAIVALAGICANIGLAIFAKIFTPILGLVSEQLIRVNLALAFYNLIPWATILPIMMFQWASLKPLEAPYIEGEYVFFGSRPVWAFMFFFTIFLGISFKYFSTFVSLLLSLFFTFGLWIAWHYFLEPELISPKGPWPIKKSLIAIEKGPTYKTYKKIAKGLR
ncbi:MAG: site-2 protease family protein [Candidatus Nanoarchaeia archaeon]